MNKIENNDNKDALKLIIQSVNSLSAFSEVQAYGYRFDKLEDLCKKENIRIEFDSFEEQ